MKKCNRCGLQSEDQVNFCTSCGASDFTAIAENDGATLAQPTEQAYSPMYSAAYQPAAVPQVSEEDEGSGNVIAGIVGSFLFALIGGFIYFIIYQLNIIAGISGLIIFVLANFGYGLFARTKNKASVVALVVSIIVTVVMIFLAEYVSLSYEIFQAYKEYDITIFDAIRATPDFLTEPEIAKAVGLDLLYAYVFGFVATIGNIINMVKAKKKNSREVG